MTNQQAQERERIIFGSPYDERLYAFGGIRNFDRLTLQQVEELLDKGYLKPHDAQNSSPTAQEFVDFVKDSGLDYTFHGYSVSPERVDNRVTIEGIEYDGVPDKSDIIEFVNFARFADALDIKHGLYCWYD